MPAIGMAGICRAAHLPVSIGSTIESGIGTMFGAHIAAALPNAISTELCGTLLLAQDLLVDPIRIENGAILPKDRPGLGSETDPALLERRVRSFLQGQEKVGSAIVRFSAADATAE